jgi:hypothetical protein
MEDKNESAEPCAEISTDDLADLKRANADLRDTIKTLDKQLEFHREQAFVSYRTMPFFREWLAGEIAAAQTEEFEKVIESYNTDNNILPAEEVVEHVAENIDLDDAIDTYNAEHDIRAADDIAHDVVQSLKDENEQNILDEDDVESIVARILDNVSITLSV